jgi:cob(I)alamin adenosyltransferase
MKGYIHVYTGNGKGKTTAAFGLALRACGAGLSVFIGQFIKGQTYHENVAAQKYLKNIEVKQYGLGCFIIKTPTIEDIKAARKGLEEMKKIILGRKYDVVVMDEVTIALHYKLFAVEELLEVIEKKPRHVELVLTGRYAPPEIIEVADLVTEMKEVKHYYRKGIETRKGIEF